VPPHATWRKVENPANANLKDLNAREIATFVPLIILAVWIGIYPTPFLVRLEPAVKQVMLRVDSAYGPAYAKIMADCNTPEATAKAQAAAPPGFAANAPCDEAAAKGTATAPATTTPKGGGQ